MQLIPDHYYHIYNRGNNGEDLFLQEKNYNYFLTLYYKYIFSIADTFAYAFLKNHFHFLVRLKDIKTSEVLKTSEVSKNEVSKTSDVLDTTAISKYYSQKFSNFFNAYAKAFNKQYNRKGSLFQTRFGRKRIQSNSHLIYLVQYIHLNPQRHTFVQDFRDYPYTSYHLFQNSTKTIILKDEVLDWFDGYKGFEYFHNTNNDFSEITYVVKEDL